MANEQTIPSLSTPMASFETGWSMDPLLVSDTLSLDGEALDSRSRSEPAKQKSLIMTRFTKIAILFAALTIGVNAEKEKELWCYQCNADLTMGSTAECNDPYTPAAFDLVHCPPNESHLCIKSLIFYKNVHMTVRGCVPAKEKSSYCSVKEAYPQASVECLFCKDYACNTSPPSATSPPDRFLVVSLIALIIAAGFDR